MSQYVGKTISLVNKANVRYIGTLFKVSAETSTLVLQTVKNYGTEDRVSGAGSIPGDATEIPEMTFLGSDVKDLQVLDEDRAPETAASQPQNSTKQQSTKRQSKRQSPKQQSPDQQSSEQQSSEQPSSGQLEDTDEADTEFFYAQTRKFAQEDAETEVQADPVYNKSLSFFDKFTTTSQRDPAANVKHYVMNKATFGEEAARSAPSFVRGRDGRVSRDNRDRDSRDRDSRDSRDRRDSRDSRDNRDNRGGRGGRGGRGDGQRRGGRDSFRRDDDSTSNEPTYYFDKKDNVFRDKATGEIFTPAKENQTSSGHRKEVDAEGFITTSRRDNRREPGTSNRGGRRGASDRASDRGASDRSSFGRGSSYRGGSDRGASNRGRGGSGRGGRARGGHSSRSNSEHTEFDPTSGQFN